jgi:hypothetical protein
MTLYWRAAIISWFASRPPGLKGQLSERAFYWQRIRELHTQRFSSKSSSLSCSRSALSLTRPSRRPVACQTAESMSSHRTKAFPVSSFQVEGWLGQLDRLRRWHQRLCDLRAQRATQLTVADLDLVFAFFQTAYHLRDWILNDRAASKRDLDELMHGNLALKVCRDLCIGSKHLLIERASIDQHASVRREYVPGPAGNRAASGSRIVITAGGKHELWPLVEDCMAAWETWVATMPSIEG